MQANKISAYLGFAIRSGSVIFGVDAAESNKKKIYIMLFDETLSANSKKNVEKLQAKYKCKTILVKGIPLNDLVYRNNCKFVAVTDKNLSMAIEKESEQSENFEIYPWEEKE